MAKSKAGADDKKKTVKTVKKAENKVAQPKVKKVAKKTEPKSSTKKDVKKTTVESAKKNKAEKTDKKTSSKSAKTTLKIAKGKSMTDKKKKGLSFPKAILENFKKIIDIQKIELIQEIESLSGRMDIASSDSISENSIYSLHMADQGTDAMEREKNYLFAQRNDDHIKRLDEALKRIENGTYGICVVCGKLIEKKRLEAVPTTQKHVDCKNKAKRMNTENVVSE